MSQSLRQHVLRRAVILHRDVALQITFNCLLYHLKMWRGIVFGLNCLHSVCLSVCLSVCNALTFEMHWRRMFVFSMQVYFLESSGHFRTLGSSDEGEGRRSNKLLMLHITWCQAAGWCAITGMFAGGLSSTLRLEGNLVHIHILIFFLFIGIMYD